MLISIAAGFLTATFVTYAVAEKNKDVLDDGIGTPTFTSIGADSIPPTANTVAHWTSAFTSGQVSYPFGMVGTDPSLGSATTTVPVALIPVRFVFADGRSLDGTPTVPTILASPIFQNVSYTSGTTQFGDAIMRAEFWPSVSTTSPDWHVLLGTPTVYPTQVIDVPANQASEVVGSQSHKLTARIDYRWFVDRVNETLNKLHIPPTALPIFHTYNSFLALKDLCCIAGYHFVTKNTFANGNQLVQTGIVDNWVDHGIFRDGFEDIDVLSHEVSEWLNDPFTHNPVPAFGGGNIACQNNLETGDFIATQAPPNENTLITLSGFTYHLQNEALLPWFSREVPSSAIGGAYSYPDPTVLTSPSAPCQP
jgi:hypothetical protein